MPNITAFEGDLPPNQSILSIYLSRRRFIRLGPDNQTLIPNERECSCIFEKKGFLFWKKYNVMLIEKLDNDGNRVLILTITSPTRARRQDNLRVGAILLTGTPQELLQQIHQSVRGATYREAQWAHPSQIIHTMAIRNVPSLINQEELRLGM